MADIVYLDHAQYENNALKQQLLSEGKDVRTRCFAIVELNKMGYFYGSKQECESIRLRNPDYDGIVEISITKNSVEKIYWVDEAGRIRDEEIPSAWYCDDEQKEDA